MKRILFLGVLLLVLSFSGHAIKVKRTIFPAEIKQGGEVVVAVEVTKEGAEGFAKLMETIPEGFVASEFNSAAGNFIYENGKLRIIWLTMPDGDSFRAEYKLKYTGGSHGAFNLDGKFYYVKNDKRAELKLANSIVTVSKPVEPKKPVEVVAIPEVSQPVVEEKVDSVVNEVAEPATEEVAETPVVEEPKVETKVESSTETTSETGTVEEVKEEVKEDVAAVTETPVVEDPKVEEPKIEEPKVEAGGLVFKVQLGAYSSEKPTSLFGDLPEVHYLKVGEIYKYYSGNYTSEADARANITKAKAQGFKGAFLVRFKDGKRI